MEIETEQEVTLYCVCPDCGCKFLATQTVPIVVEVEPDGWWTELD